MKNEALAIATILVVSLIADTAAAKKKSNGPSYYALYQHPVADTGLCLPSLSESANTVLGRNNMKATNATTREKNDLARSIQQVERLLGKSKLPKAWAHSFYFSTDCRKKVVRNRRGKIVGSSCRYISDAGLSRSNMVTIRRPKAADPAKSNAVRYLHELGHFIGGTGFYSSYSKKVVRGGGCHLTSYCRKGGLHEQFAEVFAAYVAKPDMLLNAGPGCKRAYDFFAKTVFPGSEKRLAKKCYDSPVSVLLAGEKKSDKKVQRLSKAPPLPEQKPEVMQ